MAKQEMKTDVAVQNGGAITDTRPDFLKAGKRGQENVQREDLVVPRLELVQALSPARKKGDPNYIEGAEEGMLYNSVTRELYGDSVKVVPCYFIKEWLIWKDRKKGGGFRGAFGTEALARAEIMNLKDSDGKPENPEDYEALDTAQMFCLLITPAGKTQGIVISMSRSKMKIARNWNSLINLSDDDSFAKAYRVAAIADKNKNGDDFFNLKVTPVGYVNEEIYKAGEAFYELLKAGGATADRSGFTEDDSHAVHGSSGDGSRPKKDDGEF